MFLILTVLPITTLAQSNNSEASGPHPKDELRQALKKIESRLAVMAETQEKILEGQAKLSEEHQQLRYWVHRK